MPLTLKQLQNRRDQCLEKIEEHRAAVREIGGDAMGQISFNAVEFFGKLVEMSDQHIKDFLNVFPQLPDILDLSRQAAVEEERRRKYQADIVKKEKKVIAALQRKAKAHSKKELKAKQRMKKIKGGEIDSSQELRD